jgi:hypothetical protein
MNGGLPLSAPPREPPVDLDLGMAPGGEGWGKTEGGRGAPTSPTWPLNRVSISTCRRAPGFIATQPCEFKGT